MFTVESVTDLKWSNVEKTVFVCNVKYAEFADVHPSGVNSSDTTDHIREIWEKANQGVYGPIADPDVPTVPTAATHPQPATTGAQEF